MLGMSLYWLFRHLRGTGHILVCLDLEMVLNLKEEIQNTCIFLLVKGLEHCYQQLFSHIMTVHYPFFWS